MASQSTPEGNVSQNKSNICAVSVDDMDDVICNSKGQHKDLRDNLNSKNNSFCPFLLGDNMGLKPLNYYDQNENPGNTLTTVDKIITDGADVKFYIQETQDEEENAGRSPPDNFLNLINSQLLSDSTDDMVKPLHLIKMKAECNVYVEKTPSLQNLRVKQDEIENDSCLSNAEVVITSKIDTISDYDCEIKTREYEQHYQVNHSNGEIENSLSTAHVSNDLSANCDAKLDYPQSIVLPHETNNKFSGQTMNQNTLTDVDCLSTQTDVQDSRTFHNKKDGVSNQESTRACSKSLPPMCYTSDEASQETAGILVTSDQHDQYRTAPLTHSTENICISSSSDRETTDRIHEPLSHQQTVKQCIVSSKHQTKENLCLDFLINKKTSAQHTLTFKNYKMSTDQEFESPWEKIEHSPENKHLSRSSREIETKEVKNIPENSQKKGKARSNSQVSIVTNRIVKFGSCLCGNGILCGASKQDRTDPEVDIHVHKSCDKHTTERKTQPQQPVNSSRSSEEGNKQDVHI